MFVFMMFCPYFSKKCFVVPGSLLGFYFIVSYCDIKISTDMVCHKSILTNLLNLLSF